MTAFMVEARVVGRRSGGLSPSREEYRRSELDEQTGALRASGTILSLSSAGSARLQEEFTMITMSRSFDSSRRCAVSVASIVLFASCAPALAQTNPAQLPDPSQEDRGTIQVTGQAQISVPSDLVRISFTVETEGRSAGEATAGNAREMEAVISAIRGMEIPGMDIQTYGYNLRPEYEVSREGTGTRAISGYRVQNNIRVMLPDVDATGRVLDRAVEAGANRVADLQFEASDTREARLTALREAVASAREQAETIASAMGVRLGIALEIQGGANAPTPRPPGGIMLRAAAESTTPLEASDQVVTAMVTVTFRILEGAS
jgi:uncharacterized protein YggE